MLQNETIISSRRKWLDLHLRELWQTRELVGLFVWRDFVSGYKQTVLGPAWYVLQPILTTLTFTIIFGRIAQLPTSGAPDFLFYMAGNIVWSFFSGNLTTVADTFINNAGLFGKVYFPRLSVPISTVLSSFISFFIQLLTFVGFWLFFYFRVAPIKFSIWLLALPFLLLLMGLLAMGVGLIFSSLTTRYRDLRRLLSFIVQLWMYGSSVIFPFSSVPEQFRWLIKANPIMWLVEGFRYATLGVGFVSLEGLVYSVVSAIVLFLVGAVIFTQVEKNFIDTV